MSVIFAVICEAEADFRIGAALAERVLRESIEWVDEHLLLSYPIWFRWGEGSPFLLWKDAKRIANDLDIRPQGHFGDVPGEPDAQAARRALLILQALDREGKVEGVILLRDDDRQTRRRLGLEQAREQFKSATDQNRSKWFDRIAIGLAHLKRECWVLQGFEPANDAERSRLELLRFQLKFDPIRESHRLADRKEGEVRNAKRVLSDLTLDDHEREARCWEMTPLQTLRDRGEGTGLAGFLDEIAKRLVPAFGAGPTRS